MGTGLKEQQITLNKFKTVNTYFRPFKLPTDHLSFAMNIDFTEDGKITQRAGSVLVNTFVADTCLTTWNEIRDGEVYERLLAKSNDTLYMYNDTTNTFESIYTGLPTSGTFGGIGYVNKFVFNCGANIYVLQYNSTTGVYEVTNITQINPSKPWQAKSSFYEVFAERVWLGGDGTENVYFSSVGDPTTWSVLDFIAFSGKVTAIKAVSDYLFIGTDRGLYKITKTGDTTVPFKVDLLSNIGVAYNGIFILKATTVGAILVNGRVLAFDSYIQSGNQVDDTLGMPIQDVLNSVNKFNYASVSNIGDNIYFSYTLNNNLYNIGTIVLNTNTLGWSFYSIKMDWVTKYKGAVYFSTGSSVYKLDSHVYTDNGNEFECFIITPIFGGETAEIQKNWRKLYITTESKTKTKFDFGYYINLSQLERDMGSKEFYSSDARLGFAYLGQFTLGGTWLQQGSLPVDVNSNGLMLKITKSSIDSDFQINDIKLTFYVSYRRG